MLRTECLPRPSYACLTLTTRLVALGLGIAVAGCSTNVSRFDAPMFGLTESGNRVPIPRESVLAYSATAPASDAAPYTGAYGTPPRNSIEVSSLPGHGREVADYGSTSGSSPTAGYDSRPPQPGYGTPHQPAYRQPTAYQPSEQHTPAVRTTYQQPAYQLRTEQRTRVAALTPVATPTDSHRPQSVPPVAATPAQPANPADKEGGATGNPREVVVQSGDTLYNLSRRYGASISELMTLNGLRSPVVRPGQRIMLPDRPSAMAASVRRAPAPKAEGTRVAALTETPTSEPEPARPATAIVNELTAQPRPLATAAPQESEAPSSPGSTYTIRNGESLYGIAVRHGIPLAELQRVNNIADPRKVRAGTVLKLPSPSQAPAVVASAPEQPRPEPTQAASPQTVAAEAGSVEPAAKPVIINAPRPRVAALGASDTISDAAPTPPVTQSAAGDAAKADDPQSKQDPKSGAADKFRWPVRGKVIAAFGRQPDGSHSDGIKLAVPLGTEVHAAESGVVLYAGNELKDYGNLVLLRHDNGWITAYAHNDELSVKRGDRVRRGQVIAKAGNSGSAGKPQLHFELRQGSSPVDPLPHLAAL